MIKLTTPLSKDDIFRLKAGDAVYLTGVIYTGRDAAHKRLVEYVNEHNELPFELESNIIYYVGPAPAKPGQVIGSAGPTSSYRMDPYSYQLMPYGLNLSIGKGPRSEQFKQDLVKNQGIYFSAVGGAAALISKSIKKAEVIYYEDLGAEAIYKLYVEDFPVIVTYDAHGNDLLEEGQSKYRQLDIENL